jgi:Lipid A 3-O-deacylase (PagL)
VLILSSSFGQKAGDIWIEGRAKLGFLAAHRAIMGHLSKEAAIAGEVSYLIQPKGRRSWQEAYKYPVYGVTGFFGSVGNRELLGHYFGLYGFINFPFVKAKHYTLSAKVGCGIAYGSKFYDADENILGMAVGTPFNAHISLALENRFVFGKNSINASIDMTHFSNGAFKVPNLGLNLPYISIGYGRLVAKTIDTSFVHEPFAKYWEFGATGILSAKEVFPTGGKKYPVFGINLVGRRIFKPRVGMEVSFDVISKQAILNYQADVRKTQAEIIQLGVFVGYVLPMNHFHIVTGMGVYVRDKYKPEDVVYHRIGVRYVFDNGINLNLVLKTHFARADYVEYGIGYTFKR